MRAITVEPGKANNVRLEEVPEPVASEGTVLLQTLSVGICGTDREIIAGEYGRAPDGASRLILGHESLAKVLEAPEGSGFEPGELVVVIVRRPDPVPCANCAAGEWDMCRNGRFTEHGISGAQGFMAERVRVAPEELVKLPPSLRSVGVLLEPASVLAKAWEHIERIGSRAVWRPATALITGAGPIGLLAAMMARQRGLSVRVLDRNTEGPKPELVKALGASYHNGSIQDACQDADVIIECTGVGSLVVDAMTEIGPNGIVCLTGVSSGHRAVDFKAAAVNRELVLENNVVFGSVNANRRHYERGVQALEQFDRSWLERLLNRRVPLDRWKEAFTKEKDDVKTVLDFAA